MTNAFIQQQESLGQENRCDTEMKMFQYEWETISIRYRLPDAVNMDSQQPTSQNLEATI